MRLRPAFLSSEGVLYQSDGARKAVYAFPAPPRLARSLSARRFCVLRFCFRAFVFHVLAPSTPAVRGGFTRFQGGFISHRTSAEPRSDRRSRGVPAGGERSAAFYLTIYPFTLLRRAGEALPPPPRASGARGAAPNLPTFTFCLSTLCTTDLWFSGSLKYGVGGSCVLPVRRYVTCKSSVKAPAVSSGVSRNRERPHDPTVLAGRKRSAAGGDRRGARPPTALLGR